MEVTTVVGIVIAVIIMLFGLRMLFKKPADAAPSLDSELHVDSDSQQPVIPRHVRDQLQNAAEEASSAEPIQDLTSSEAKTENAEVKAVEASSNAESAVDSLEPELAKAVDVATEPSAQVKKTEAKEPAEFSLNANIAKAEISEFEEESSILDEHLHEQQRVDEESALSTAVEFIALNIYPERRVLSGEITLKVLLKYGFTNHR